MKFKPFVKDMNFHLQTNCSWSHNFAQCNNRHKYCNQKPKTVNYHINEILFTKENLFTIFLWNPVVVVLTSNPSETEDAISNMLGEPEQRLFILKFKLKKCLLEWKGLFNMMIFINLLELILCKIILCWFLCFNLIRAIFSCDDRKMWVRCLIISSHMLSYWCILLHFHLFATCIPLDIIPNFLYHVSNNLCCH
jgi:hypothetical protein